MEAEALEQFEASVAELTEEIAEIKPLKTAPASLTQEDRDIDQMLERMAKTNPIQDLGPELTLKREPIKRDVLRNYIKDYKPASSLMELEEQVHMAVANEIDSIEATPALVRHVFKRDFEYIRDNVGYAIYKNIRVYIDGYFEKNKDADLMTMEKKLHGGSKNEIGPIITPQKI